MFIHRPELYEKDTRKQNVAEIIIAKHRNGPVGTVELVFRENLAKFENAATRARRKKVWHDGLSPALLRAAALVPSRRSSFSELLPEIDHLGELKVTLYALWRWSAGRASALLRGADLITDEAPYHDLGGRSAGTTALEKALERGAARQPAPGQCGRRGRRRAPVTFSTPRAGGPRCRPSSAAMVRLSSASAKRGPGERPNIFRLYEENIGPLTPLIAEMLREAEQTLPGLGGRSHSRSRWKRSAAGAISRPF